MTKRGWWDRAEATPGSVAAPPPIGIDSTGKFFVDVPRCRDRRGRQWAGFDANDKLWVDPERSEGWVEFDYGRNKLRVVR